MKHRHLQAAFTSLLLPVICAHAATLSWDNGASTGNWNTTDANWTGSTWNNGTPDSALFSNINGNVALTEAISAGTLSFHGGGWQSGARQLALSGSTLSLGSILVNGFANGGNVDSITDAYNQRLAINGMTLNATGNVTVQRGMFYTYNGAVVNVSGGINSTDAWNVFRMDSGSVTATTGVDFSVIASQVEILGGTLTTPFIKVGNAAFAGTGGLSMSGGATVVATQNNSDFIQVYNNGDTGNRAAAWVGSSGVTLNTSTFNVTVATQLNGDGALTKSGSGTLTLTSANTFTGGTTVNAGTLQLQANGGYGNLQGTLTVNSGATVVTTGDGTGLGWQSQRLGTLNINGGTVTSAGQMHVWSMGGGVNMQGGTLQSNNGVSTASGSQLEWGNTQLNTSGNATATIAGRVHIRTDAATNFRANVGDGTSATDLLVTAAFTQSSSSGVLAKLGAGTMEITSTGNSLGQISAAGGNLVLSGSSTFAADNVYIADSGVSGGGSGTLTIKDNATLTVGGNFMAGNWNNTLGVINQSGGTVNLNGGGSSIRLGHWPNGGGQGGFYNLSGGTVNMPNTSMYVGWDGYGQLNITGGTFNAYGITSKTGSSWGDVLISGGTLNVGAGGLSAAPWFHLDGGTIRATAPFTMNASTVLMNGTTFDTNGNNVVISSWLQNGGAGGLVKTGAGTLTLTNINSYTGGTIVNGGTLSLAANSGYARVGGVLTVNSGATVETTGDGTGLGYYDQLTTLNVNGGTATSAGTMHIWNLTGGINLTGATLQSNNGVSNASGPQLEWNRTSVTTLASATTSTIGGRINIRGDNGYATVDLTVADGAAATDLVVTAAITEAAGGRGIAKHGPGTMVLSGNNSYSGATTINDGLVIVQNGNGIGNLSNVTLNNASQLRLDANESVGSLAGSATSTVNIQGHTLQLGSQLGNATATYDGVISGTGALVRRGGGTQTLTGNNSFSGSVTVQDGGTLSVPSVAASGNQPLGAGTGNISLDGSGGGATLAITGAGTYNLPSTRGLALSGSGGILNVSAGTVNMTADITGASNSAHFTKSGAGTFNFSGDGSWSGNFTVSAGTFNLTGGGSIPGVGSTTIGGALNINTTGLVQTSSLDILSGGTVNLDAGTLRVGGGGLGVTGRSIDNAGGSFTWGSGTLAVYTTGSGEAGLTDRTGAGGSPSGPAVKEGNYLSVAGSLNAPSGSTLDLGSTYLSNGLRYNQLNVDGNLTLNDGTLNIGLSPYFLRPNTPDSVTVGDWGTMVLVYAEGTMSGTFAQLAGKTVIPGISNDGIGWTQLADIEYTGGGTPFDPSTLNLNEWVIEYRDGSGGNGFNFTQSPGAVVLLHYKVAGSVPEPASVGLLVAGTLLLRAFRRRRG